MIQPRYKYSRTYHLDWSLSLMNDDRRLPSLDPFIGQRVVVTEKMDGENTSMYSDFIHARSIDSCRQQHESRDMVKRLHGNIKHMIPEGWRICGENMYAKHSIYYDDLESYFLGFAVYDENNVSLPWDDAVYTMQSLGITPVKVLYDGIFDEQLLRNMAKEQDPTKVEGYVCRVADAIPYSTWFLNVAKYVRAKHVQTDVHWMAAEIIPNKLRNFDELV